MKKATQRAPRCYGVSTHRLRARRQKAPNKIVVGSLFGRADRSLRARQQKIFEEKGRELVSARNAPFLVDCAGLLAGGGVAGVAQRGDLFMRESFEKQQRDLFLGLGELPEV